MSKEKYDWITRMEEKNGGVEKKDKRATKGRKCNGTLRSEKKLIKIGKETIERGKEWSSEQIKKESETD